MKVLLLGRNPAAHTHILLNDTNQLRLGVQYTDTAHWTLPLTTKNPTTTKHALLPRGSKAGSTAGSRSGSSDATWK